MVKKAYSVETKLPWIEMKKDSKKAEKRDEMVEKIEQLCMQNQFIYGYRTITRFFNLVVNRKAIAFLQSPFLLFKNFHFKYDYRAFHSRLI